MIAELIEDFIREPCWPFVFWVGFTHEVIAQAYTQGMDLILGPRPEAPYF